jgi:hypothetical protein
MTTDVTMQTKYNNNLETFFMGSRKATHVSAIKNIIPSGEQILLVSHIQQMPLDRFR